MDGPNVGTAWGDSEVGVARRQGVGALSPNDDGMTAWGDTAPPEDPRRRAVARSLEVEAMRCEKCAFETRSSAAFSEHVTKVDGLLKCERERAKFQAKKAETSIDEDGLAEKIATKTAEAIAPALKMIAEALGGFKPKGRVKKAKKEADADSPGRVRGASDGVGS